MEENLDRMSATGYFDPTKYMYYEEGDGDSDLTPVAGKDNEQPN